MSLYSFVRLVGALFRFRVEGLENLTNEGPAIYVANHLGSTGPIQLILSLPVRLYPWVIGEMTDPRRAPLYLYNDFVHPTWGLHGRPGMLVATAVSRIAISLFKGIEAVSVDRNRGRVMDGFRRSLSLLADGKALLILPEDASRPADPATRLHPFFCGFIGLCYMSERATGRAVPIYPLGVHAGQRAIAIGKSIYFEDRGERRADIRRTCGRLQKAVSGLYKGMETG